MGKWVWLQSFHTHTHTHTLSLSFSLSLSLSLSCFLFLCFSVVLGQLDTAFKGGVGIGGALQCTVRFQGKSVLAGIKQLARQGLAEAALPKHLRELASAGANRIIVSDRTATAQ